MRAGEPGLGGATRILCYGVTGSGKTTLAARLSQITGIGWTEADSIGWLPGWQNRGADEQRRMVGEVVTPDAWILDSCYSTWLDVVLPRTELIVGLDYPRWRSLLRLLRRTVARNLDHREICNGNVETWRQMFSRDSIIAWHVRSFASKHERLIAWEADPEAPRVLRLRRPGELEAWLARVRVEAEGHDLETMSVFEASERPPAAS